MCSFVTAFIDFEVRGSALLTALGEEWGLGLPPSLNLEVLVWGQIKISSFPNVHRYTTAIASREACPYKDWIPKEE